MVTDREAERQRDREAERQRDREAEEAWELNTGAMWFHRSI